MNPVTGISPWDASMASSKVNRDPSRAVQSLSQAEPLSQTPFDVNAVASASNDRGSQGSEELQTAFQDFVGQTLFGSLLASMRKTLSKPAYMHGGRTEEVFQQQLDQHIVDDMTKASAATIAGPMYDLFNLQRRAS